MPTVQTNTTILPEQDAEQAARRAETVVCLSKLPPFHAAALKLLNISSDSSSAIDQFEAVFRTDPALTADLLLVANSPLFGNRARIGSIRHAMMHLGLHRVRSLGNTIALGYFVRNQPRISFVRQIWAHSVAAAVIAEVLGDLYGANDMYTPGLVHDLGRLGLLLTIGAKYENWVSAGTATVEEVNELERARFGMNHCEAGALVGHKWGFPVLLRSCMIAHHGNEVAPSGDPLVLVQLACRMADALGFPEVHFDEPGPFPALPARARECEQLKAERLREGIRRQIDIIGG